MKFKSGEIYEGQWADNKPHGIGVLQLKDESSYEGGFIEHQQPFISLAFANGKRNGEGTLIVGNRYQVKGSFKDNYVEGKWNF